MVVGHAPRPATPTRRILTLHGIAPTLSHSYCIHCRSMKNASRQTGSRSADGDGSSTSNAVVKAYAAIRERIVSGDYPPASRITEQEISDTVGVSRTPAREALRQLQAEGFVRVVPYQGAVVAEWTAEDVDDIFELRAMLEPYGASRAASRITVAGIAELRQLAVEQHSESRHRRSGYLQRIGSLNSRFHHTLHQFAGSSRLNATLSLLVETPLILQFFAHYRHEDLVRSARHHLEIVDALEARDGDWAAAVMRAHILAARGSPHTGPVPTGQVRASRSRAPGTFEESER